VKKNNDKSSEKGARSSPSLDLPTTGAEPAACSALTEDGERERERMLERELAAEKEEKNELRLALETKREQHRLAMRQLQAEQAQYAKSAEILRAEKELILQQLQSERLQRIRAEDAMGVERQQREFANKLFDSAQSTHSNLEQQLAIETHRIEELRQELLRTQNRNTLLERELAFLDKSKVEIAAALEVELARHTETMESLREVQQERDDLADSNLVERKRNQQLASDLESVNQQLLETRHQAGSEREAHAAMLRELQAEKSEHTRTRDDLVIERSRKVSLADFLNASDLIIAGKGLLARIFKRFAQSELAQALRDLERSRLFDRSWYETSYPDVVSTNMDPLAHYLLRGAFEGRNPSSEFHTEDYLAANPDVKAAGINPLLHYVRWGRKELRRVKPGPTPTPPVAQDPTREGEQTLVQKYRPVAPAMSFFHDLAQGHTVTSFRSPEVDVIVPVYRGYDDTLACLASVLTSRNSKPYELIVIDDCSPEPDVSNALDQIAALGLITLLRNEQNQGFVGTVNRGMSLHADRDVVLLNSDAMVFNDWLDRICAHAANGKISSVTPFTNNGTICSYPIFCRDNNTELEIPYDTLDRLVASINRGKAVEVPTGVGFCMFISRAALKDVGLFDQETFGKGYGEENDFCMRARKRGWRDVHALDVFVFHSGETSFAQSASESKKKGLAALQAKHPEYDGIVREHLAADPARSARIVIDAARLFARSPSQSILCFTHAMEGGIVRYLQDRTKSLREYDCDVLVATPTAGGQCTARVASLLSDPSVPNLQQLDLVRDVEVIKALLSALNTTKIEVHSTVGWSHRVLEAIRKLSAESGIPYTVMVHDYVPVCPQINLIDGSGHYCGERGIGQCQNCVVTMRSHPRIIHPDLPERSPINIVGWRTAYLKLLKGAQEVCAPSADTATRLNRYFPDLKIVVEPHSENLRHIVHLGFAPRLNGKLRVAVIGAIGPHKGSNVLLSCARDALARDLPLEFVVVGFTDIDDTLRQAGVTITGRYSETEVGDIIRNQKVQLAFLPSVWPETYCYTLSIGVAAGLPTCAFDLGAPAERLRNRADAFLLPVELMTQPGAINDRLLEFDAATHTVVAAQ
jgi:GT2 family glycosyltransferase/glycosyltransferase involved in cell wall biosynthesis